MDQVQAVATQAQRFDASPHLHEDDARDDTGARYLPGPSSRVSSLGA
jgi:hypothetical protein